MSLIDDITSKEGYERAEWQDTKKAKSYDVNIETGSITLVRCPNKVLMKKPYKKRDTAKNKYYLLYGVDVIGYSGKKRVLPSDNNIVLQFAEGTKQAIAEQIKDKNDDDWEYLLIYRMTERTTAAKILTEEEVQQCQQLSEDEVIQRYFTSPQVAWQKQQEQTPVPTESS